MNNRQKYDYRHMLTELTLDAEQEFYPLSDKRTWTSNVEDIDGGDNFADYCKEFFELLEEEGYYDN